MWGFVAAKQKNVTPAMAAKNPHAGDIWLWIAAASSGFGIWATQFITMLAYDPDVPSGYNLGLTLSSLFAAILLTGIGLSLVAATALRRAQWLGGAIVGIGIGVTHCLGAAAYDFAGRVDYDPVFVVVSLGFVVAVGAAALPLGLRPGRIGWRGAVGPIDQWLDVRHRLGTAGARALVVDRLAPRDGEDPGAQIARMRSRVGAQRGDEGLLEAVVGVGWADHPAQERPHGVEVILQEHLKRREALIHHTHPTTERSRHPET